MNRRSARKHAFELIFQIPFHAAEEYSDIKDMYLSGAPEDERQFINDEFMGVVANLPDIDKTISESLTGWLLDRVFKSDLAVLRLAVYEITYAAGIPTGVAINEAVELAKTYGTDESYGFVNAVLGKLVNG